MKILNKRNFTDLPIEVLEHYMYVLLEVLKIMCTLIEYKCKEILGILSLIRDHRKKVGKQGRLPTLQIY